MFNTPVLNNNHLDSPYELVSDNKWTIEKMLAMASDASKELDGNMGIDPEIDIMGMIGTTNPDRAFMTAFNLDLLMEVFQCATRQPKIILMHIKRFAVRSTEARIIICFM